MLFKAVVVLGMLSLAACGLDVEGGPSPQDPATGPAGGTVGQSTEPGPSGVATACTTVATKVALPMASASTPGGAVGRGAPAGSKCFSSVEALALIAGASVSDAIRGPDAHADDYRMGFSFQLDASPNYLGWVAGEVGVPSQKLVAVLPTFDSAVISNGKASTAGVTASVSMDSSGTSGTLRLRAPTKGPLGDVAAQVASSEGLIVALEGSINEIKDTRFSYSLRLVKGASPTVTAISLL